MDTFHDLKDFGHKEIMPGFFGRFVHMENFTMAFWNIKAGSSLPEHHHIHEQVTHLVRGRFEMTVDGKTQICEAGGVVTIPSNVVHKGHPLTDCYVIDVFQPAREDYK